MSNAEPEPGDPVCLSPSSTGSTKMRPLEMGVCKSDGTWYDGVMIEIPDNTPDDKVAEVAAERTLAHPYLYDEEVAHVFLYNRMEDLRPE